MAVGIRGSFKTSNHVVAKFQVHQAERRVQLGRQQGTLAAQLQIETTSNRETGGLNSVDGFERDAGAGELERHLLCIGMVEEISRKQPGGPSWGMRRQPDLLTLN